MKIEVVVDPSRLAATPSLASRVAPVENTTVITNGTQTARSVAATSWASHDDLIYSIIRNRSRGGVPRGRGRKQGPRKTERPQKTVEDLDAEMEVRVMTGKFCLSCTDHAFLKDYTTSNAAPAAAAAV